MGDGPRALRYLGLAPESQLREVDFANAIHACAASSAALLDEAVGAFRRLEGLGGRRARAGWVCVFQRGGVGPEVLIDVMQLMCMIN